MVLDVLVPGDIPVQVRFYRPHERPLPLIVYLHGGAFIFGDLDTHDRHDLLRDEGEALAQRLLDAGTNVLHVRHPGLVHGFLSLDIVSPAALDAGNNLLRQFGSVIRDVAG